MALTPYTGEEVDAPKLTPYTGAEVDPTATPSRLRRFVADPLISVTKGAIALPEAAVGLADIVSGGEAGKLAERIGFRPKQAKEYLDTLYSPEQQQANAEVAQAKGFLNTVGASFRRPSTIAHSVIESAPLMLGGAGVARGLLRAGVPTIAAAAAGEGITSAGSTAEAVRQETGDLSGMKAPIAAGSGVLTSVAGAAGGRLARRFGVVDVDTLLAGGASKLAKKDIAKGVAGGIAIEGGFEEAPQSAQEQAAMNLATGKPLKEGVAEAAAKGAVTGGAMGGGFNAAAAALGVGTQPAKVKEALDLVQTLPDEEQKAAVQAVAAEVHAADPAAAVTLAAEMQERIDAGDAPLPEEVTAKLEEAAVAPTRSELLEAVAESLTVEENPLEVLEQKGVEKVAEALAPTAPAVTQETAALTRAQLWIKEGRTVIKEGKTPDAEVAAHLDDLGYTLVPGERADKSAGGSVARREWLVQEKQVEPAAPEAAQAVSQPLTLAEEDAALTQAGFTPKTLKNLSTEDRSLVLQQLTATGAVTRTVRRYLDLKRLVPELQAKLEKEAAKPPVKDNKTALYSDAGVASIGSINRRRRTDTIIGLNQNLKSAKSELEYYEKAAKKELAQVPAAPTINQQAASFAELTPLTKAEAAQAAPQGLPPLADGEKRLAYADNPNIVVERRGDRIAIADVKNKVGLGIAKIKDNKVVGWVEGKAPESVAERSQLSGIIHEHMGGEGARFSRSPFHSKLEQVVTAKMGGRMPVSQLLSMLKANGVSDAEIDTAIGTIRDEGGTATKQQVLEEIKANSVEFEDVVLDDNSQAGMSDNIDDYLPPGAPRADASRRTHFSQYTEPGAVEGSYREMFVTVPDMKEAAPEWGVKKIDGMWFATKNGEPAHNYGYNDKQRAVDYLDDVKDSHTGAVWQDGHSQYSNIQNPIVRIRFNERNADGKRIMFIEEMQGASDANQQKMPDYLRKRIYDIGVKRVLAYAKENGFDGVAWTTGAMQAARYDLSKQLDSIGYADNGDGTYGLSMMKDGAEVHSIDSATPEELGQWVGKEVAQKIIDGEGVEKDGYTELSGLDLKVGGEGLTSLYDRTLPALFKKYGKEGVEKVRIKTSDTGWRSEKEYQGPEYTIEQLKEFKKTTASYGPDIFINPLTGERENLALNRVAPDNELRDIIKTMEEGESFQKAISQHGGQVVDYLGGKMVEVEKHGTVSFIPITDKTQASYPSFNRGAGQGLPQAEIAAHLDPIIKGLKVPVTVVATASEVPGLKTDVRFTGVFHQGRIYLNAEHLSSLKEAEDILLRHEIRHAGLRSLLGRDGLDKLLAKAWGDLNSGVREFAKERGIETKTKAGKLEAAEEYIVELAKTDAKHPLWDRFVEVFKAALRRLGFSLKYSDAELRSLVARAGEAVMVDGPTRYAAAWHGSPHKFDKFTTKAIGTGEGAQAYGWGLYFAGAKEVAEYYRKALSSDGFGIPTIDGIPVDELMSLSVDAAQMLMLEVDERPAKTLTGKDAKAFLLAHLGSFTNPAPDVQAAREEAKARIARTAPDLLEVPGRDKQGRLYQVELAPSEDEYLLWDKPLSEQSEKVKEGLAEAVKQMPESEQKRIADNYGKAVGKFVYQGLGMDLGSERAASEYLHSLGIRGIKYLDGTSRNKSGYRITWENGQTSFEQDRSVAENVAKTFEKKWGKATITTDDTGANFNFVIFNDEDVQITAKFSRLTSGDPKPFLDHASTQVAKRVLSDISGNIWRNIMAVDRTIEMARSMPLYAPIKDLLARYVVVRKSKAAATDEPLNYGRNLEKAFDKAFNKDSKKIFDELVAKATLYELHANGRDSGWTEKSWKDSGKEEKHGLTLGQARAEVAGLYGQLNDEQKAVHRKIIDHMRVLFDKLAEIELAPLKEAFGKEAFDKAKTLRVGDASPERLEYLRKLHGDDLVSLAQQVEARTRSELRGDYAPLSRFGNHIVRTLDADGKRIKLQAFESKKKADEAIASIQAAGLTAEYDLLAEANKVVVNIPEAFLNKMRRAAEARGITGGALDDLMDDFAAARVQTMPSTSLAGTGLHREGVEGYDPDMLRSYAAYVNKAAHAIAYAKYGRENEQIFRDMDQKIKDYQKEPGWKPHAVERMSSLRDTLYKLDKTHDVERINELVKGLGKISFIWYLSSPSIWAVQWSQPFLITVPKLAARHGFTKALAAYVSEAKEYLAGKFSDEKIDAFNVAHENAGERLFALIEEERKAPAERRPGLRRAMKALYNGFTGDDQKLLILKVLGLQGVLDISSSHELMDLITGAGDGRKLSNKVVSKLAFFMQKSEAGSRRAAAVSSFKLAMERDGDFAKANDYTADIISDTLGDFTSENRPWLLRGNSGRLFGQFRFFQIHMLGKTVQLAKDAYQEDGWGERRKELSYMLAMSLSLAGAAGTPLSMLVSNPATSAILAAIGLAFGDPDDPWDPEQDAKQFVMEAMGDEAGQAFLYGLPALFGIDVHKRIGLGGIANIVSGDPPPGLSATERAQWYAGRLAGPSFGIVSDTMRAGDAVAEGDLVEAFKMSSPKVIKDAVKAMHLAEKGAVGAGGRVMIQPDDVSPTSIALQLLGVNPMEVALAQEERSEIAKLSTALRQRRSLLLKRVTEATLDADYDAKEDALGAINEWGLKQPALRISQMEMLSALKKGRAARSGEMTKREALVQGMLKE